MVINDKQHRAIAWNRQKQARRGKVFCVERNLFMSLRQYIHIARRRQDGRENITKNNIEVTIPTSPHRELTKLIGHVRIGTGTGGDQHGHQKYEHIISVCFWQC